MSELRDQHKAFAEWFLQQNPIAPNVEDRAWAAWKAALAQPEAEPVAWMYDWEADGEVVRDWVTLDRDEAHSPTMGCHNIRPLYTHPPRNEWRPASEPPEGE